MSKGIGERVSECEKGSEGVIADLWQLIMVQSNNLPRAEDTA